MKILLDTNIIIHREAKRTINQDIGQLFRWIDNLKYEKWIHPITIEEISKYKDSDTVQTFNIKLDSYNQLKTLANISPEIQSIIDGQDKTENDRNDSLLLNELFNSRVDIVLTEDKNLHSKAQQLGIEDKVFNIDLFLKRVLSAHPELINYKVLSVKKEYFGNIDVKDSFFDSLKEDYSTFENWFNSKHNETAYIIDYNGKIKAFLYIKLEDTEENYHDIIPAFGPKRRLKIGTFKVILPGLGLGERFLKIIFDNAINMKVDEIYVTTHESDLSQTLLVDLFKKFGFFEYGAKRSINGEEKVLVRDMNNTYNIVDPRLSFPFIKRNRDIYFVSIYPQYHTELFPDSILRTENPEDFIDNEPHRNSISKVYISHAYDVDLKKGDLLVFYMTGGIYKGVVSTIGVVESMVDNIDSFKKFRRLCQGRTVLSEQKLETFWNYKKHKKPFVVNLLYSYSLPKRINLKGMIDLGIFPSPTSLPRGFGKISWNNFMKIFKASQSDESIIID